MNNVIDVSSMFALAPGPVLPGASPVPTAAGAPAGAAPALIPSATARRVEGATPGCYALFISDTEYHQQYSGASSSGLKQLLRSPAHYQAYLKAPDKDSEARRFGRAVHALLLEAQVFNDKFTVWTDGARRGKKYDEFAAQHAGKTILNESEHTRALEAALALRNCPDMPILGDWLDEAAASASAPTPTVLTEFSIFWDEAVGEGDNAGIVNCKARVDLHGPLPCHLALDVKTTDDVRDEPFMRQFMSNAYDLQAAHYCAGLKAFYGEEYQFLFAAVEHQEPFASRFFEIERDVFMSGVKKREKALGRLLECQRTNVWPSYSAGIRTLRLRPFDRFRDSDD